MANGNDKGRQRNLTSALSHMPTDHLQCRDFGHAWRPYHAEWSAELRCYVSELRCSRCRTVRQRLISRTGEQLKSGYQYVDGYQLKGIGRLTGHDRDFLRLESLRHVLPEDALED